MCNGFEDARTSTDGQWARERPFAVPPRQPFEQPKEAPPTNGWEGHIIHAPRRRAFTSGRNLPDAKLWWNETRHCPFPVGPCGGAFGPKGTTGWLLPLWDQEDVCVWTGSEGVWTMASARDGVASAVSEDRRRVRSTKQRTRDLMRCMVKVNRTRGRRRTHRRSSKAGRRSSTASRDHRCSRIRGRVDDAGDNEKELTRSLRGWKQAGDDLEKKEVLQRKLEALQAEAEDRRKQARVKKINARYKRVKFFERRKLERRLKQIDREQKERPDDPTLVQSRKQLLEDLEYVRHFPPGEKYVSILVEGDEQVQQKREEWRRIIKENLRRMAEEEIHAAASEHEGSDNSQDWDASSASSEGRKQDEETDDWDDPKAEPTTSDPLRSASEEVEDDDFFLQEGEEESEPSHTGNGGEEAIATPSSESEPELIRYRGLGPNKPHTGMEPRFNSRSRRDPKVVQPPKAGRPSTDITQSRKRKVADLKPAGVRQQSKPSLKKGMGVGPQPRAKGEGNGKGKKNEKDRPGKKMPLRTRAEGGRKRRKKKK
eukprot:scaffold2858_cov659-Pavlova_lutheri.AAC.68